MTKEEKRILRPDLNNYHLMELPQYIADMEEYCDHLAGEIGLLRIELHNAYKDRNKGG